MAKEVDEDYVLQKLLCRIRTELRMNEHNCYLIESIGANAKQITVGGGFVIQVAPREVSSINQEQSADINIVTMPVDIGIITGIQLDRMGRIENALLDAQRGTIPLAKKLRKALIGWDLPGGELASLVYASGRARGVTSYDLDHSLTWRTLTFHFDFDESTT